MFEVTTFETRQRVRGIFLLTAALGALIVLTMAVFPSIESAGVDLDAYLESLPPEARRAFVGNVTSITTIEGYLVSQLYQFGWLLILGVYFAYTAASTVAKEVERTSVDLLLAAPISRTRIVVGKFLALVPTVVAVNALTLVLIWASVAFVGEKVPLVDLVAVHAVSIPYLLACAALGLVASVSFDTARRAQTVGIGAVFGTFLLDSLTFDTDYEWLGDLAFARYYDPGEILVEGTIDWTGVAILLAATVVLMIVAAELFERREISA
jgi:ABC-2 type transport system permease protein